MGENVIDMIEHKAEKATRNKSAKDSVMYVMLLAVLALLVFNSYQIAGISTASVAPALPSSNVNLENTENTNQVAGAISMEDVIRNVIPTGTPDYGNGLGVSYDDPTGSLNVLQMLDSSISFSSLTKNQQDRYNQVATMPHSACEFCCGIGSQGFGNNGRVACGCSHNLAFSGLTKWLLVNKESEYNNDMIYQEIQKWKALWFPKQMISRYAQEMADSGQLDASAISQLPNMVGGC